MRAPTRELAAKAFGLAIFATVGLIRLNIMGLDLSALALLGGAVGVGLGFGLQMIASSFVSGIIILVEGQATLGDLLELDGGGRVIIRLAFVNPRCQMSSFVRSGTEVFNLASNSGSSGRMMVPTSILREFGFSF